MSINSKEANAEYGSEEFEASFERLIIPVENNLLLKQLCVEDSQEYSDLINYNPEYFRQKYEGGMDDTAEKYPDAEAVVNSIVNPDSSKPGRQRFGIWADEAMVGSINLTPVGEHQAEIGYLVGEQYRGQGYAPKAVEALSSHAFKANPNLGLIFAHVFVGNDASRKVLEKAGYKFTGEFQRKRDGKQERLWNLELRKNT